MLKPVKLFVPIYYHFYLLAVVIHRCELLVSQLQINMLIDRLKVLIRNYIFKSVPHWRLPLDVKFDLEFIIPNVHWSHLNHRASFPHAKETYLIFSDIVSAFCHQWIWCPARWPKTISKNMRTLTLSARNGQTNVGDVLKVPTADKEWLKFWILQNC